MRLIDADEYEKRIKPYDTEDVMDKALYNFAHETLMMTSTAQPEREKGEWISLDDFRGKYNEFGYKCSECGIQNDYQDNFCPNCGAEMRR